MVVINNIDRNYRKEAKCIEDIEEGGFFEFKNDLYIKTANSSGCVSISQGKECVLRNEEVVFKVIDCEIEYSLIKDKK